MKDKRLLFARRLDYNPVLVDVKPEFIDGETADVHSEIEEIFKYIFGTDPNTGLPVGDLAIYLGNKANPEIRNFIEQNLLQPVQEAKSGLSLSQDAINAFNKRITDDDIAQFSRNANETREEYADRMRFYFAQEKLKRAKERDNRSFQKQLDEFQKRHQ